SMYRFPYLASHAYLSADVDSASDPARLVRALAEGDTLSVQLAALESETAAAIERGLRHALDDAALGESRVSIANDLAPLLEARQRNALDMLPVYEGVTEVLTQRESAQDGDDFVGPEQPTEDMVP